MSTPLDAEPAQARLERAADAFRREAVVGRVALDRVEDLGREHDPLAHVRPLRREPVADPRLAAAAAVRVGRVERRDPGLPRGVHQRERLSSRLALPEERGRRADAAEVAAAEDEARDLDAAAAEGPGLHPRDLINVGVSATLLDVAAVRQRFSSLQGDFVFLDAPGGSQVPDEVGDAIARTLREASANIARPTTVFRVGAILEARGHGRPLPRLLAPTRCLRDEHDDAELHADTHGVARVAGR